MFLVSGIPRSSTTLVAKLLSLDESLFCYAGETHLISFLHNHFEFLPCDNSRVDSVVDKLNSLLIDSMIEMPSYSIANGAHPKNIVFNQQQVSALVARIASALREKQFGKDLFLTALNALENVLEQVSGREYLGEKTPDSIFAIASYGESVKVKNFTVVREPIGVLRSMNARVKGGDPFSDVFSGGVEANIGMYLQYSDAIIKAEKHCDSHLVRFEDIALNPGKVVTELFDDFGITPDERVLSFVEKGNDSEIADLAPMYYQRLQLKTDLAGLSQEDVWKILNLTKSAREVFGYDDDSLKEIGLTLPDQWPGPDIPKDMLMPVSGFGVHQVRKVRWWKKDLLSRPLTGKARLVLYLKKFKQCVLRLTLVSNFPEEVLETSPVSLTVSVNNRVVKTVNATDGAKMTSVDVPVDLSDISHMGARGAYVFVELEPSLAYCPAIHTSKGRDERILSFELTNWKVN